MDLNTKSTSRQVDCIKLALQNLYMLGSIIGLITINNELWNELRVSMIYGCGKISYGHGNLTQFQCSVWKNRKAGNNKLGRK